MMTPNLVTSSVTSVCICIPADADLPDVGQTGISVSHWCSSETGPTGGTTESYMYQQGDKEVGKKA